MKDLERYFNILGLKSDATCDEVQGAYAHILEIWNPALFTWDPEYQREVVKKRLEGKAAYDTLNTYFVTSAGQTSQENPDKLLINEQQSRPDKEPAEELNYAEYPPKSPLSEASASEETGREDKKAQAVISYRPLAVQFGVLGLGMGYALIPGVRGVLMGILLALIGGGAGALMAYYFSVMNTPKKTKDTLVWVSTIAGVLFIITGLFLSGGPLTNKNKNNATSTFLPDRKGLSAERDSRWLYLSESPYFSLFYDAKSITRKADNIVRVWVSGEPIPGRWRDYIEERRNNNLPTAEFEQLSSVMMLNEIRCPSREIRVIAVHEADAQGHVLHSRKMPDAAWEPILPESKGEALLKVSCPETSR